MVMQREPRYSRDLNRVRRLGALVKETTLSFSLSSPSFQKSRITSVPRSSIWRSHPLPQAEMVLREGLGSESAALSHAQSGGVTEGARSAALPWLHRPQGDGGCCPQSAPTGVEGAKEAQDHLGLPSARRGCQWWLRWPQAGLNVSLKKCLRSLCLIRFT